jgi:hypothetical protein
LTFAGFRERHILGLLFTRLRNGFGRWRRLSRRDRTTTVVATLLVPTVSISLTVFGFRRTLSWLEHTAHLGPGDSTTAATVREGEAAVARVRRRTPWAGRCLARALSLWWILRWQGVDASLNLGVRLVANKLEAHAWVVHAGRVLADSADVSSQFSGRFESANGRLDFNVQPDRS